MKGKNKGKRMWNDGVSTVFRLERPGDGWKPGYGPDVLERRKKKREKAV